MTCYQRTNPIDISVIERAVAIGVGSLTCVCVGRTEVLLEEFAPFLFAKAARDGWLDESVPDCVHGRRELLRMSRSQYQAGGKVDSHV